MNHIELFAGIGGFRQAMNLIEKDFGIPFKCIGFSEIDAKAKQTYKAVYSPKSSELDMGDIVAFNEEHDGTYLSMEIDLLTGGFPCQAFSMMGKQEGFNDDRGLMFFQIRHILQKKKEQGKPIPFVLLENVKNLLSHDKGRTFKVITSELEKLGYKVYADVFNAADFKQAQTRNRVLIFATTLEIPSFTFSKKDVKNVFDLDYSEQWSIFNQPNVLSVLDKSVDDKYYLSERIKPTILSDGSGNFKAKSEINQLIARTLTASMHKMHRACQDNYYSDGFIKAKNPLKYLQRTFSKEELCKQRIRKLTPEEAFNLQGFPKQFASKARKAGVPNGALLKQAGNAVSVNMIYAVLYYLFIHNKLYSEQ